LKSNTKGYGNKTHQTDSQNSDTTAPSGRELYHLQFSLQTASPETFGYTLVKSFLFVFRLREEHRLRVSENRALRRIFVPKREEVVRGWRRLHTKGLHNLTSSPNVVRVIKSSEMRWAECVARMVVMRNEYNILVVKPEGKSPIGRPRRRREITLE
jgi:hypothetical protein